MAGVSYHDGELDLQYIFRGNHWSLRLISPQRFNGVRVYVEQALRPDAQAAVWLLTFRLLYKRLTNYRRSGR